MSDYFHLDELPDLFLVDVMGRLPLEDLVRLDKVSTKWRYLQGIALRRINRLDIMIGVDPGWLVDRNKLQDAECIQLDRTVQERHQLLGLTWIDPKATLTFASLDQDKLEWLTKFMPGIRTLTIVQDEVEVTAAVAQVTTMVNHWRRSLTSLTILSDTNTDMSPELSVQFFNAINRLPRLQDLSLKLVNLGDVLDLPILERIRRFVFYWVSYHVTSLVVMDSLRRYATNNDSFEQIHLDNPAWPFMPEFLDLDQSLASKITGLISHDEVECPDEFVLEISTKFHSLTHLRLDIEYIFADELVAALVNLPQLYYLELNLYAAYHWFINYERVDHDHDHTIRVQEGAQLASIQVVKIEMGSSANHQDFHQMFNWPWTFPSLRVVNVCELGMIGCGPCGISVQWTPSIKRTSHCTRQLLSPFTGCPLLHKLTYRDSRNHTRWDGPNWTIENGV